MSLYHRDLLRDDLLPQVSASSPTLSLSRLYTDEFSFHSSALCSAVYVFVVVLFEFNQTSSLPPVYLIYTKY